MTSPGPPSGRASARGNACTDAASPEVPPEVSTVVSPIRCKKCGACTGPPSAGSRHADGAERGLGRAHLRFACAVQVEADGDARTVYYEHPFDALSAVGQANRSAPFFAGTNEPSRKAVPQSRLP
jgi:hypothetical protein